jgi:hypothetical protein
LKHDKNDALLAEGELARNDTVTASEGGAPKRLVIIIAVGSLLLL